MLQPGRAMPQVVNVLSLAAKNRVQSHVIPCRICGGKLSLE
jgi:hypothetical protein